MNDNCDETSAGDESQRTPRRAVSSSLRQGEVHIWYGPPRRIVGGHADDYLGLLTPEELARYRRFLHSRDRCRFLAARVLLRTTLSQYASVEPADWAFVTNPFGRPEIAGPSESNDLRFNISHTLDMVVCAIARHAEVGVDVEDLHRNLPDLSIARRYFSPSEYQTLLNTPPPLRAQAFFTHWTVKEAYIKARGLGLSLPLDSIVLERSDNGIWAVKSVEDHELTADRWRFAVKQIGTKHLAAAATKSRSCVVPSFAFRKAAWLF